MVLCLRYEVMSTAAGLSNSIMQSMTCSVAGMTSIILRRGMWLSKNVIRSRRSLRLGTRDRRALQGRPPLRPLDLHPSSPRLLVEMPLERKARKVQEKMILSWDFELFPRFPSFSL